MRLITLIAAHHERASQLRRVIDQAERLGPVVVLSSLNDGAQQILYGSGVVFGQGFYQRERIKRNDLLALARMNFEPQPEDWLLTLDADETLIGDWDAIPLILDRFDADVPAYPLLRQEVNGAIWALPSKLMRGDVQGYTYLDIGVQWHGEPWKLDAWVAGDGVILPGWPAMLHFGNDRTSSVTDIYYSEDGPYDGRPYPEHVPPGAFYHHP